MAVYDWKLFASAVATFARIKLNTVQRGALIIRCLGDGNMVAAVFGNDNYASDAKVRQELEIIRHRLPEAPAEELGFGLSPDQSSWALLVRADTQRYQTTSGKLFQTEMLKAFLDDAVQGAWQTVSNSSPTSADRYVPEKCPR